MIQIDKRNIGKCRDNRSDQKGFVNVYATANRINNFQKYPSSD